MQEDEAWTNEAEDSSSSCLRAFRRKESLREDSGSCSSKGATNEAPYFFIVVVTLDEGTMTIFALLLLPLLFS